jgi:dihydroorotase-like cyclic amidohydrolase
MEPFYIKARTVFPEGIRPSIIGIDPEKGIIISVEDSAEPIVGNQLLFPGFIDAHVHAREYPTPPTSDSAAFAKWGLACRKEVFATAGNAAINGGVTLIAAMPNDLAPPDNPARYFAKMQLTESSPCPVVLFETISRTT